MRQRVLDCDAQYSHVLLCHDMQVWSVKIVSCRLRIYIYGFRTSSQRGLARSSSVARRTAEEAISCARKACRKSQKTPSNHWQNQSKSIKINQNHYQNHSKSIPFHWQFQCIFNAFSVHIRRPWTSTRAWWCWMPKRARRRFSSFLHRVTLLSKAFDVFEYWSSYNWYWIIVSSLLSFFHSLHLLKWLSVELWGARAPTETPAMPGGWANACSRRELKSRKKSVTTTTKKSNKRYQKGSTDLKKQKEWVPLP